jgi:hypothetical protein
MYMALCDMIEVKGCESIRILRNLSRNDVLTIAAFISGHGRSVHCGQPPACRRDPPAESRMCHRIHRSVFAIDFIDAFNTALACSIGSTGGIMLSFSLISHCSEPRSDR